MIEKVPSIKRRHMYICGGLWRCAAVSDSAQRNQEDGEAINGAAPFSGSDEGDDLLVESAIAKWLAMAS